jgi:D-alanyl-D-alanine carboxypeptidase (penicillin-binding protein 5/6)
VHGDRGRRQVAWALSAAFGAGPLGLVPVPPPCHCRAAVVMDADTGQVLWADHAYRQMDPASLTKMMTAYLVIQQGHLDRVVTVSKRAAGTPGSRLHVAPGDRYTVLDLLRGLLLRSGNDAAVALAEADAGSVAAFVARMNEAARRLGAYQTHFVNPNGLTARGHYSSAYDLALIARAALRLPLFQHLVSTTTDYVEEDRSGRRRTLFNTNRLLETFPPADGIKTGTTNAAGKCLAASATAEGMHLIAVVLSARNRWQAAEQLLRWAFSVWRPIEPARAGTRVGTVRVLNGQLASVPALVSRTVTVLIPRNALTRVFTATEPAEAPVRTGSWVGAQFLAVDGEPVATWALVAAYAVPRRSPVAGWWQWWRRWVIRGFIPRRPVGHARGGPSR